MTPTASPLAAAPGQTFEICRRERADAPWQDDERLDHRVLALRGVATPDELLQPLTQLPPSSLLANIELAVARLARAVTARERLLIVGDYDCDGATSTALAMLALQAMGAERVDYLIPNRALDGYGLSPEIVARAIALEPALILTVDNGVASHEGVAAAQAAGVDVVVTDHHLPGEGALPDCTIINPNLAECAFPGGNLAGVGVVFFVLGALSRRLRDDGWFAERGLEVPRMGQFLDLVAIGTVADVVKLDQLNRTLVQAGIERIRAGRTRPGVLALLRAASIDHRRLVTQDIGFGIGPRLNAAGRISDMTTGVRCLLAAEDDAPELARELNAQNVERKRIGESMQAEADALLAELLPQLQQLEITPMSLCLYRESWHEGIIGIVAGRLKERFNRPVVVFAKGKDGQLKGSARSIPELHIRDALFEVRSLQPTLFNKFGGHAMAAGLTLPVDALARFRATLETVVRQRLGEHPPVRQFLTDGILPLAQLTLDNAASLRKLPWGQGFEEACFDGIFSVVDCRVLKQKHCKMTLQVPGARLDLQAIGFNQMSLLARAPETGDRIEAVYCLEANEFKGHKRLQLRVLAMRLLAG